MALVKCKECATEVSSKAKVCPKCGAKPPKKTSLITWIVVIFLALGVLGSFIGEKSLTPEQLAKRQELARQEAEQRLAEEAREAEEKAKVEAEKKQKGFHCLSLWDGSHRGVKSFIKERLRDPDSFEHVETKITPVDAEGNHTLYMTYRAKNGFGGMNVETVQADISNANCSAKVHLKD